MKTFFSSEGDCSVCLMPYSRVDRVPRVLHCRHTFCETCLETMSQARSGLLTVGCPLCRRVTCIGRGLSLQEALWVNSRLWEQIPEDVDAEIEEEGGLKQEAEAERIEAKQQPSLQAEWWVNTRVDIYNQINLYWLFLGNVSQSMTVYCMGADIDKQKTLTCDL
uniref:Im:7152348 n=1 Tax=Lates calcarifer TaxID=8187 RepID=A0A4W6DDN6_LATCA